MNQHQFLIQIDGKSICSLEEFKKNWCDKIISEYLANGTLLKWLEYLFYYEEAEKVKNLEPGADMLTQLKCIFGMESQADDVSKIDNAANCVDSEKEVTEAKNEDCFDTGKEFFSHKEYSDALKNFVHAAANGNRDALGWIAVMYQKGYGVDKNLDIAITYYLDAAKLGHSGAMNELGEIFQLNGNYPHAMIWYQKALDYGNEHTKKQWGKYLKKLAEKGISFTMS